MRYLVLGLAACLLCAPAYGAPIRVSTAGDSLSIGYTSGNRLGNALGDDYEVRTANTGGMTAAYYAGGSGNLQWLLALDPDVAVIMLGTNDVLKRGLNPSGYLGAYKTGMTTIFDALDAHDSDVVLLNLPPLTVDLAGDAIIDSQINPWLAQQAASRGYTLGDVNSLITSQPNWQALYGDGIHMGEQGGLGYTLIANYTAELIHDLQTTTVAVPEPTAMLLLATLLRRRR